MKASLGATLYGHLVHGGSIVLTFPKADTVLYTLCDVRSNDSWSMKGSTVGFVCHATFTICTSFALLTDVVELQCLCAPKPQNWNPEHAFITVHTSQSRFRLDACTVLQPASLLKKLFSRNLQTSSSTAVAHICTTVASLGPEMYLSNCTNLHNIAGFRKLRNFQTNFSKVSTRGQSSSTKI